MNGIDFFVDTNTNNTNNIKEIAIAIKQKYSVKIPDAIIAATAKNFDMPLITADMDLKKIEDVNIVLLNL
jgi:predicted nucleic acid-binding protein